MMKDWIANKSKAIAASAAAGLTALAGAITTPVDAPTGITKEEWFVVLAAVLLPFGITWAAPKNTE